MLISVISAKGGAGASAVSSLFATALSSRYETVLIDACGGDLHGMCSADAKYSFEDWLNSKKPSAKTLNAISIDISPTLSFVASSKGAGSNTELISRDVENVVEELVKSKPGCVLDLGSQKSGLTEQAINASDLIIFVMRQCYLSLMAATTCPYLKNVDALAIIKESGRSISVDKIAEVLGLECVIEIDARKDFARTIDAGVLPQRPPKDMISPIEDMLSDVLTNQEDVFVLSDIRNDLFNATESRNDKPFWDDKPSSDAGLSSPFLTAAKKRVGEL